MPDFTINLTLGSEQFFDMFYNVFCGFLNKNLHFLRINTIIIRFW